MNTLNKCIWWILRLKFRLTSVFFLFFSYAFDSKFQHSQHSMNVSVKVPVPWVRDFFLCCMKFHSLRYFFVWRVDQQKRVCFLFDCYFGLSPPHVHILHGFLRDLFHLSILLLINCSFFFFFFVINYTLANIITASLIYTY